MNKRLTNDVRTNTQFRACRFEIGKKFHLQTRRPMRTRHLIIDLLKRRLTAVVSPERFTARMDVDRISINILPSRDRVSGVPL